MLQSKVRRFEFAPQSDDAIVQLDALELVSVTGQTAFFSSSFALLNRGGL
jgi:cyclopropane fatty-acyl-phospholipid synthase-like methyltransferase